MFFSSGEHSLNIRGTTAEHDKRQRFHGIQKPCLAENGDAKNCSQA